MSYILLLLPGIITFILTGILRSLFIKKKIFVDSPNDRSSHKEDLVRAGGISVVTTFILSTIFIHLFGFITFSNVAPLIFSILSISIIGLIDDHSGLKASLRLFFQFLISAFLMIFLLEEGSLFAISGISENFTTVGYILTIIYIVWLINLFNFMDGINGIVSLEAISTTLAVFLILHLTNTEYFFSILYLVFAICLVGFLPWNFPIAKIFMGDCCAYFIGLLVCIFSLDSLAEFPNLFWVWLILLGVFIIDSSFTLLRRMLKRKKIFQSHREHAYQNAAIFFESHTVVTLSIIFINIAWLFPIAFLVAIEIFTGPIGILIAYLPLMLLWLYVKKLN